MTQEFKSTLIERVDQNTTQWGSYFYKLQAAPYKVEV